MKRMSWRRPRLALSVTALAVATAATAATASAASAPANAPDKGKTGCISFGTITEKVVNATAPPATFALGDSGSYTNFLYSDAGVFLGTATGSSWAVEIRPADHHIIAYVQAADLFSDGSVHESGLMDVSKTVTGAEVDVPAIGTTGKYVGMVGTRSFKRLSPVLYTSGLTLCPRS